MVIVYIFLSTLAKLRKVTISFVMSVRPSVRIEQLASQWTDFSWNFIFEYFSKNYRENSSIIKPNKNNGYITWRPIYIFLSYLAQFFLEWEMFQTQVVEKIKTHFLYLIAFFRKSCLLWDNVEKYCRRGGRPQMTIRRRSIACWIPKATKHAQVV